MILLPTEPRRQRKEMLRASPGSSIVERALLNPGLQSGELARSDLA